MKNSMMALVFGVLAVSPAAANAQDWYRLPDGLGYLYFADDGSIVRSGDEVEIAFLAGDLNGPSPGESSLLKYRLDCKAKTLHLLGGQVFTDEGAEIPDLPVRGAPAPVSIDSVSPGDHFYEFACPGGHRETRVDKPFEQIGAARAAGY